MGDLSAHFDSTEFACGCGCGYGLDPVDVSSHLVELLEDIRRDYGQALKINSGCRCKSHNDAVGGIPTSAHLRGTAADVSVRGGENRYDFLAAAFKNHAYGIGQYKTFVHVDVDEYIPRPSSWPG